MILNISGEQAEGGKETQIKEEELDETPVITKKDELTINENEFEKDEGEHVFHLYLIRYIL